MYTQKESGVSFPNSHGFLQELLKCHVSITMLNSLWAQWTNYQQKKNQKKKQLKKSHPNETPLPSSPSLGYVCLKSERDFGQVYRMTRLNRSHGLSNTSKLIQAVPSTSSWIDWNIRAHHSWSYDRGGCADGLKSASTLSHGWRTGWIRTRNGVFGIEWRWGDESI